ncbi:helix-turn-helix domain-containing protein [Kutzneria viridogrisea]|uniref:AcrR family transcriptional regulator n=1 Tax=Kutzneria viridogrisea TaxID=47990 RepID=A0ABR6BJN9_9PSEU|nr:AcrR family transcriptional regulator [Kutzneria viridogrisea]
MDKPGRILDAAERLLVDHGYRRVTVDEVAKRAGVGKGTVYLYWPSKLELFGAVISRRTAELVREQLAALRADPAEVLLHRAFSWTFRQVLREPLTRALYTGNQDVLGELMTVQGGRFAGGKAATTARYLEVLHAHGLLAGDPAADPLLSYRLSATISGFFLLETVPGAAEHEVADKAQALATTLRLAFEPTGRPAPQAVRAAATELAGRYEQWAEELTKEATP